MKATVVKLLPQEEPAKVGYPTVKLPSTLELLQLLMVRTAILASLPQRNSAGNKEMKQLRGRDEDASANIKIN